MQPKDHRDNWFKGQGLWADASESDWRSWTWQLRHRITTLEQIERHMRLTPEERAGCIFARDRLALAITPYFFNLIDRDDPECPVRRQVIPREGEAFTSPEELLDPVGEEHKIGRAHV